MNELWQGIVSEALKRGVLESKGAVPGAKLRQLIAHTASQHGTKYPPEGFENESFGEFLKRFDSILVVLRRKAQDILIAPADQSVLLIRDTQGSLSQLRDDIFEAFTHIPRSPNLKEPWYDRTMDNVLWLNPDEPKDPAILVPIPPGTKEQEIADRRAFAQFLEIEQGTRDSLLRSLEEGGQSVLWAFSQIVRSAGLSRKWHMCRFQQLTVRIRAWCEAQQLPWRVEWLVATDEVQEAAGPTPTIEMESRVNGLQQLFASLSEDELRRISVPLDIVLKIIRR